MNIVRYQRYPPNDLFSALNQLAKMRAEMDRVLSQTWAHCLDLQLR